MARSVYDILGDFVLLEREYGKSKINNHAAITLLALDNTNLDNLIEIYPQTDINSVFLYKDSETPIDLLNPDIHLTEEQHELLRRSPLAGGVVCLDQNGWIPIEYMDKHFIALYVEFETFTQMLEENTYDEVTDYGRLLMVHDIRDEQPGKFIDRNPFWGIYRLTGNPKESSGWTRIFNENYDTRIITWEDVGGSAFKSTVEEIDAMVKVMHRHNNLDALDQFSIDEDGRLLYCGQRIMYREDYNTLLMDVKEDQLWRLRGGDSGAIVYAEHAVIPPIPATYVDTTDIENIDEFYKNRADISGILLMDTAKYKSFTQFAYCCYNLKTVPALDYSNTESLIETFKNCTRLEVFYGMNIPNAFALIGTWENCKSLEYIGDITVSEKLSTVTNVFKNCERLDYVPVMDYSNIKFLEAFCFGCKNIRTFNYLLAPINFDKAFYNCTSLINVGPIDFSRCKTLDDCFYGCDILNTVTILPKTLFKSISFENTMLRIGSACDIIEGLPTVSTTQIINLRNTPASGISSSYIDMARNKGWSVII